MFIKFFILNCVIHGPQFGVLYCRAGSVQPTSKNVLNSSKKSSSLLPYMFPKNKCMVLISTKFPSLIVKFVPLRRGFKLREALIWPYSENQIFKYFLLHFHIYFRKTKYVVFIHHEVLHFNCEIHGPMIKVFISMKSFTLIMKFMAP